MIRGIGIRPVLNGWIVEVGCQTVVFDNMGDMLEALEAYLRNPDEVAKSFLENSVNSGKIWGWDGAVASDTPRPVPVDDFGPRGFATPDNR